MEDKRNCHGFSTQWCRFYIRDFIFVFLRYASIYLRYYVPKESPSMLLGLPHMTKIITENAREWLTKF
jgi:hypothetical protein